MLSNGYFMLLEISMGKSRAEIQKAYRQRLKDKNKEEYLRKESESKRRIYVPSHQLFISYQTMTVRNAIEETGPT